MTFSLYRTIGTAILGQLDSAWRSATSPIDYSSRRGGEALTLEQETGRAHCSAAPLSVYCSIETLIVKFEGSDRCDSLVSAR